jgi:hypothetical protein
MDLIFRKNKKIAAYVLAFVCASLLPGATFAADESLSSLIGCTKPPNCTWPEFIKTINNVISFLFKLAVTLATISFAYAGWLYLTARGDEGQTKRARGIFGKVIMGFIIMSVAWLAVKALMSIADPSYSGLE